MKKIDFKWKDIDGIVIIAPGDHLDVRNGIAFKEFIESNFLEKINVKGVILDLREVNTIDSFIIGIIVALYKKFQSSNKKFFILCSDNSHVEEVLNQYNLSKIIPVKNELKQVLEMIE